MKPSTAFPHNYRKGIALCIKISAILAVLFLAAGITVEQISAQNVMSISDIQSNNVSFTANADVDLFRNHPLFRSTLQQQPEPDQRPTVGIQEGKYGVGFASTWPAFGLSGTYHFNEFWTGEAIFGFFGALSNFGARGWYRFNRNHNYDLYGYGALSLYRHRFDRFVVSEGRIRRSTESVPGIGAGAGLQYGLRSLFDNEDFPPLFFNLELGVAWADFDYYNFSSIVFGSGLQYRFGGR